MVVKVPYGRGFQSAEIPKALVLEASQGRLLRHSTEDEQVLSAMRRPIMSPKLVELARGKDDAVIIISDHTRPVPSRHIVPHMIKELRAGNPNIRITLLVATGLHRGTTDSELCEKLSQEVFENVNIVVHDAYDPDKNVYMGELPSGAPLYIDKVAAEASLLIAEGFIEPHFFAGYSGGRKAVLPGIAGRETILCNHCGAFIADDHARAGILQGNPLHRDMIAAAKLANLKYIVNVIIDDAHRVAAAFAGEPLSAHEAGSVYIAQYSTVAAHKSDIVVTSNGGYPLDQNMYQAVKGISAADALCRDGGTIIMCAECADGVGGETFRKALTQCESAEALYASAVQTPMRDTLPDQWEYQILARALIKHEIIFVTAKALQSSVEQMKMRYAGTLQQALAMAYEKHGEKASVNVIPNGVSVVPKAL